MRFSALVAGLALYGFAATAEAAGDAGDFDFYVLALSWSPTYCDSAQGRDDREQCGGGERHGFIVHGLWPQYEKGYPEHCATDEPLDVPSSTAEAMLDIMPSRDLIEWQWRKHGACTGLDQAAYFETVREASQRAAIPPSLANADERRAVSARDVEEAFVAANPGLSARGVAVSCDGERLEEVRICLSRGLEFRRCAEVDGRGCQSRRLAVPAAR